MKTVLKLVSLDCKITTSTSKVVQAIDSYYLVNSIGAKEISKIHRYYILLHILRLLIVGVVVAECVGDTLWLSVS